MQFLTFHILFVYRKWNWRRFTICRCSRWSRSLAAREWMSPIFPQYKFNFSFHIFVVDGFAAFEIDATTNQERFLIESRPPELIQNFFLAKNSIQYSQSLFDIAVVDQHGACEEFGMPHCPTMRVISIDKWKCVCISNVRVNNLFVKESRASFNCYLQFQAPTISVWLSWKLTVWSRLNDMHDTRRCVSRVHEPNAWWCCILRFDDGRVPLAV